MDAPPIKRRLAAILAADAVGYSKHMARDEEGTLRVLSGHRVIIDGLIATFSGRIVGTAGDSVLAEFGSSVDAVRCAVEIQAALATRSFAEMGHQSLKNIGRPVRTYMVARDGAEPASSQDEPSTVSTAPAKGGATLWLTAAGAVGLGRQRPRHPLRRRPLQLHRLPPRHADRPGRPLQRCAAAELTTQGRRSDDRTDELTLTLSGDAADRAVAVHSFTT